MINVLVDEKRESRYLLYLVLQNDRLRFALFELRGHQAEGGEG